MRQLGAAPKGPNWAPTNQGFVQSYEAKGRGLATPTYGGRAATADRTGRQVLLACRAADQRSRAAHHALPPAVERARLKCAGSRVRSVHPLVSSVPGETWPNRNFMHAATSDGETNIYPRFYTNRTIFEVLERVGKTWRIYHDDTPQVWAFPALWESSERRANWYEFKDFGRPRRTREPRQLHLHRAETIAPHCTPSISSRRQTEPGLATTSIPGNKHRRRQELRPLQQRKSDGLLTSRPNSSPPSTRPCERTAGSSNAQSCW